MHTDFSIRSKKTVTVICSILFWIGALFVLGVLIGMLKPSPEETPGDHMVGFIFAASWLFLAGVSWNITSRKAQVHGNLVTFSHGLLNPKRWTIDLTKVSHVAATPATGTWVEDSILLVAESGKAAQLFSLKFYNQEDRERFLPIITELINRPGIVLEGDNFSNVLQTWFGTKAPTLASPVSSDVTLSRPKTSVGRLLFAWTCYIFAIVFLPALIVGNILGSQAKEAALDQRGRPATATVEFKRHRPFGKGAASYALVVTHSNSQSNPTTAWLYVTSGYYDKANIGDIVAITYDPEDPTTARLADRNQVKPYWQSVRTMAWFTIPIYLMIIVPVLYKLRKERKQGW